MGGGVLTHAATIFLVILFLLSVIIYLETATDFDSPPHYFCSEVPYVQEVVTNFI